MVQLDVADDASAAAAAAWTCWSTTPASKRGSRTEVCHPEVIGDMRREVFETNVLLGGAGDACVLAAAAAVSCPSGGERKQRARVHGAVDHTAVVGVGVSGSPIRRPRQW